MIRVVRCRNESASAYDGFVMNHPRGSCYHLSGWMAAIESAYKHPCWAVLCEKEGQLEGILPLCHLKAPLGSGALVSLPYCDLGGPLAYSDEVENALLTGAAQLARSLNAKLLDIRMPNESSTLIAQDDSPVGRKVSMLATLPSNPDALMASYRPKLRSQIRKAEKNGLRFELHTGGSRMDDFYPVFAANMKRLGSPVHSRHWFLSIGEHYRDKALQGLVYHQDQVVGAGVVLLHPYRASIPWASTLVEYNSLAPNMLLYWGLLSAVCNRGCPVFDFGRSTYGEGTFRFKKQWGAQPYALNWNRFSAEGERLADASHAASRLASHVRPWAETLWQHLPDGLANSLGPKIRRYISL